MENMETKERTQEDYMTREEVEAFINHAVSELTSNKSLGRLAPAQPTMNLRKANNGWIMNWWGEDGETIEVYSDIKGVHDRLDRWNELGS